MIIFPWLLLLCLYFASHFCGLYLCIKAHFHHFLASIHATHIAHGAYHERYLLYCENSIKFHVGNYGLIFKSLSFPIQVTVRIVSAGKLYRCVYVEWNSMPEQNKNWHEMISNGHVSPTTTYYQSEHRHYEHKQFPKFLMWIGGAFFPPHKNHRYSLTLNMHQFNLILCRFLVLPCC